MKKAVKWAAVYLAIVASLITNTSNIQAATYIHSGDDPMAIALNTQINTTYGSNEILVTSVHVTTDTACMIPNETTQLVAYVLPSNAINTAIIYTSSDTAVATVSPTGLVTAVSGGTATITVTTLDGGFTATSTINVASTPIVPTDVQSSSMTLSNVTLYWSQVPGSTEYYIYRDGIFIGTSPVSSYNDTMFNHSIIYCYTVSAVNISGESEQSLPLLVLKNAEPYSPESIINSTGDNPILLCSPDGKNYYDPIDKKEKELKATVINNQDELNRLTGSARFILQK